MTHVFSPGLSFNETRFDSIIANFDNNGTLIGDTKRNIVKYFNINGDSINFKSFREPNLFNKIVYRYFRKSKARRSFENAQLLLSRGLNTPQPMGYIEYYDVLGLSSSYYICKQLDDFVELRYVLNDPAFPDREKIIRAYTTFFFRMHEHGIEFLDNSPGNSLIRKREDEYDIYLVDLNRMKTARPLGIAERMKNFSRITADDTVLRIIADEYAQLAKLPSEKLFHCLAEGTEEFKRKKSRKKYFKNKLKKLKKIMGLCLSWPCFIPEAAYTSFI